MAAASFGVEADAGVADVAAVAVVDVVLEAEGGGDRQVEALGEGLAPVFWIVVGSSRARR